MAQVVHSTSEFIFENPDVAKHWKDTSNYVVVLNARDENHLHDLLSKLSNITKVQTFTEPDYNDELTSLSFISDFQTVKKIISSLPLAGKEPNYV